MPLEKVLERVGLVRTELNIIKAYGKPMANILVNEEKSHLNQGMGQDCPLSLLLFNVVFQLKEGNE